MIKKIFIFSFVAFLLFSPFLTQAAENQCSSEALKPSASNPAGNDISALPKCINQIYIWSLGVAALLALLMTIIGSYFIMTSAGNAEQAGKGKEYITGAVIGLILLFTAFILLNLINPDLTSLNFDSAKKLNQTPSAPIAPRQGQNIPTGIQGGTSGGVDATFTDENGNCIIIATGGPC